jgi:hypothetical protein
VGAQNQAACKHAQQHGTVRLLFSLCTSSCLSPAQGAFQTCRMRSRYTGLVLKLLTRPCSRHPQ